MKQAREGRFFFENRFTTEAQPRLTVNLYFWVTGTLSKVTGIPLAMHIAKATFGLFFLFTLYGLVRRLTDKALIQFSAMAVAVFGAGTGWLFWRRYGFEAPIDVWQPEAFTFPSLMQNGLFSAALWLIAFAWNKILDARDNWKSVLPGALALLALTNFHTYDTLAIAIVAAGFLATQLFTGERIGMWILRAGVIALGALPSILWFIYVRANDPVFQARAETSTFSPTLERVLFGYWPLLILAFGAFYIWNCKKALAPAIAAVFLVALAFLQRTAEYKADAPWLQVPGWLGVAAAAIVICLLYKPEKPIYGLAFAWTVMGIVALYYPGMFQRKLAMGLSIPIGLSAGAAIGMLTQKIARAEYRRAANALAIMLLSLTSLRWLARETQMATDNISNTTMQLVFWPKDVAEILQYLEKNANDGSVAVAPPGVALPFGDDEFEVRIPDVNPLLTGWAGVKTWAGHWSETPNYLERRQTLAKDLFSKLTSDASAQLLIKGIGADYIVVPLGLRAEAAGIPQLSFYEKFGKTVYKGQSFALVHVTPFYSGKK